MNQDCNINSQEKGFKTKNLGNNKCYLEYFNEMLLHAMEAVSYTHLDVYKRQQQLFSFHHHNEPKNIFLY